MKIAVELKLAREKKGGKIETRRAYGGKLSYQTVSVLTRYML